MKSVALWLWLAAFSQAYPNPGACSGDCFTHDPALVKRADGKYFRFSTLDNIGVTTANHLSGPWSRAGSVIQGKSVINMPDNDILWAPDVVYEKGQYYLFYTVSSSGSQTSAIGYATSPNLEPGTWTDHGKLMGSTPASPYNAIDANVVKGSGTDEWYLSWGSYWGHIYQARVTLDGGLLPNTVSRLSSDRQIAHNPKLDAVEGAFIYRKDNYYYLFLSVGACCTYEPRPATGSEYRIDVCRGGSPQGPFVDQAGVSCKDGGGTTILASHENVYAPGGQGVLVDDFYGEVLYYHYLDTAVGVDYKQSKFGWNVLKWGANGWPTI